MPDYLQSMFDFMHQAGHFQEYQDYEDYRAKKFGLQKKKEDFRATLSEKDRADYDFIFGPPDV